MLPLPPEHVTVFVPEHPGQLTEKEVPDVLPEQVMVNVPLV
jgi:hypothetical protein